MRALRRSILLTAALAAASAIGFAGPAAAQGYAVPIITVVTVSGDTANVSGAGWQPGAVITVTINSTPIVLGTILASASGTFSRNFTIPCVENGTHTISASGVAADGITRSASDVVTIVNCTITNRAVIFFGPNGAVISQASLPFTGSSNTFPFIGVGVGLVLAGAVLAVIAQRRRSAHSISV